MKRLIAPLSLALLVALAGCSSAIEYGGSQRGACEDRGRSQRGACCDRGAAAHGHHRPRIWHRSRPRQRPLPARRRPRRRSPAARPPTSAVRSRSFRRSAKPPLVTSRARRRSSRPLQPTCGRTHRPRSRRPPTPTPTSSTASERQLPAGRQRGVAVEGDLGRHGREGQGHRCHRHLGSHELQSLIAHVAISGSRGAGRGDPPRRPARSSQSPPSWVSTNGFA